MSVRPKTIASCTLLALVLASCSTISTPVRSSNSPPPATASSSSTPAAVPTTGSITPSTPTTPSTLSTPSTPSAPSPAPPTSPPALSDPAAVVEAYFTAINDHDYARAWALGGSHLSSSYTQFAAGFDHTAHDTVDIISTNGDTVAVDLQATNTDDSRQEFTGTYTVTGQEITAASISEVGAGPTAVSLCGAPGNPYGYNFCGRGGHVTNPPGDICNYFQCIDNFWHGRGYMVECNDSTYSMSGGIHDVCTDHHGVERAVNSG